MDIKDDIPEGDWICQRCQYLKSHSSGDIKKIRCGLCTDMKGVLVQVSSGALSIDWVHPICILWNPYIFFKDFIHKNVITGNLPEFVKNSKKDRSCAYCEDKSHKGFKIECDITDCKKCFHVTCAVNLNLIIACEQMYISHRNLDNPDFLAVFCQEHLELGNSIMKSTDK